MAQSCTTLEGINGKSNFCELNRAVKRTFREAVKNTKLAKMPKYQVVTKPIGSIGVDKIQYTNETVIFGKLEVSNEDFTIFLITPCFFPMCTGDCHCGVSDVKPNKIVSGTDALPKEFPWQVALRE